MSWLDRLPGRAARFALFTSGGAVLDLAAGLPIGLALGLADTFILDKLVRGWRPNQFIEDVLAPFTGRDDSRQPASHEPV